MNQMVMPIFDNAHPKIIEITFSFPEFATACKNLQTVHFIYSFLRYSQFLSPVTRLATPNFFFNPLLIYVNLHPHAKNQATS